MPDPLPPPGGTGPPGPSLPPGAPPATTPDPAPTPTDQGARALLDQALAEYGLEGLGAWAWDLWKQGQTYDMILSQLPTTQAFMTRYPAYHQLASEGRAITIQAYRAYEEEVRGYLQRYGVTDGMYSTPLQIADLLVKDVSAAEVSERLQLAAQAAFKAPAEVKQFLRDRYGVDDGDMVGFYLDPEKELPLLEQRYRAAEIGGAAALSRINVDLATAERLAAQGIEYGTAVQGFSNVKAMEDLMAREQGGNVTQDELVSGQFGDGEAAAQVARVAGQRAARYRAAEGGAASNQTGVSGLRSANR